MPAPTNQRQAGDQHEPAVSGTPERWAIRCRKALGGFKVVLRWRNEEEMA